MTFGPGTKTLAATIAVVAAAVLSRGWSAAPTSTATPAPRSSSDALRADVFAARDAVWRAWFGNDRPALERMLPPEFVGIGFGGGPFDDRASALAGAAGFANAGGRLRRLEFSDDRVQVFGDVVTVFSNYLVEFESGGSSTIQTGRATEVFVKRGNLWTNPAWHLDSGK